MFKSIDGDDNNKLSRAELHHAFTKAGIFVPSGRLDDFFSKVDKNNDGVITFDEWRYVHALSALGASRMRSDGLTKPTAISFYSSLLMHRV